MRSASRSFSVPTGLVAFAQCRSGIWPYDLRDIFLKRTDGHSAWCRCAIRRRRGALVSNHSRIAVDSALNRTSWIHPRCWPELCRCGGRFTCHPSRSPIPVGRCVAADHHRKRERIGGGRNLALSRSRDSKPGIQRRTWERGFRGDTCALLGRWSRVCSGGAAHVGGGRKSRTHLGRAEVDAFAQRRDRVRRTLANERGLDVWTPQECLRLESHLFKWLLQSPE